MEIPPIRYADAGGLSVAYAVGGSGPHDIVYCSNWTSHVEAFWDWSPFARLIHRLATIGRVIVFDLPGNGLSDPVSLDKLPDIEQWMDCLRVVMAAAGSERAVLFGQDAAAGLAVPFAATFPERVSALVLAGAFARIQRADDYPIGIPEERRESGIEWWLERWGTGRQLELTAPNAADVPSEVEAVARTERHCASPGVARAFFRLISDIDVRNVLPAVRVPALVMHRAGDRWIRPAHGRYLAEHIEGARYVELAGDSHYLFADDLSTPMAELRTFLATLPEPREAERMLATILFTDIVESTKRAAEQGDARWRRVLDQHDAIVRQQFERFRGREIRSTGDGFFATFDGAARAVRCAAAIRDTLRPLDIRIRAGVHSGEIELRSGSPDGIAVHIAARVAALAGTDEVLVSQTVKDLTVGAGLSFEDRGSHALKGVPGEWRMYATAV